MSQPVYACKQNNKLKAHCRSLNTYVFKKSFFRFWNWNDLSLISGASMNEQVGIDLVQCIISNQEHICVRCIDENVLDIGIIYLFSMQEHAGICLLVIAW